MFSRKRVSHSVYSVTPFRTSNANYLSHTKIKTVKGSQAVYTALAMQENLILGTSSLGIFLSKEDDKKFKKKTSSTLRY